MASYRGHALGGLVTVILCTAGLYEFFSFRLDWANFSVFVVVGLLGALFPDVDTNSRGQDLFYSLFFILDLVLIALEKFNYAAFLGLFAILPVVGKHRGWTHTWWAMLAVPLPIVVLPCLFFGAKPPQLLPHYGVAVAGYFSHLLLDWKFK